MRLRDRLRSIDPARPALSTLSGNITFGGLLDAARLLSRRVAGERLSLRSKDVSRAVSVMIAADGVARSIVLVSPWLTESEAERIESVAGVSARVRDVGDVSALANSNVDGEEVFRDDTQWVLATSGTTGTPKLVSHTLASLTRSTRVDTARGRGQVWGLLYDYTRFAGLQVVLQSVLSGACLAAAPVREPIERQLEFLAAAGCTHLSATPTLWRKILMTPGGKSLPLEQVTLGGEIADDTILRHLATAFPRARISHVYASTEAGVGFSVKDGRAGFPIEYLESPPSGVALRVIDGILEIASHAVNPGYLGNSGTFARDGWVHTGDRVDVIDDRVRFVGRANGVINVGGDKVHPEVVEHALLSHPAVSMARVSGKANPIMGSLVVADIVPAGDVSETLEIELQSFLREKLDRHMVPAMIRIVSSLDYGPAGKVSRTSS